MTAIMYFDRVTSKHTHRATEALQWHNEGHTIEIHKLNEKQKRVDISTLHGKAQEPKQKRDENWEQCKSICDDLEAYADGKIYQCPDCGESFEMPDDVGDKFCCPHCHETNDINYYEQLSLYDYFDDILDIDYIVNYRKEYKACRILVAFGGPNIYINTFSGYVELYWWNESAKYQMLSKTINAVDEWAKEYYSDI